MSAAAVLFSYNPPAGGQNLFKISSPELLTGANSCAGGAFYSVSADSIVNNPALAAYEQRATLNAAGTMLFSGKDPSEKTIGGAFETGLLLPSRWYVYSFLLQGTFVPFHDMHLGNSVTFTGSIAKDLSEKLAVGLSADIGVSFGNDSDWLGAFNLGAFYNFGDFKFMRDIRFAAVLSNLGKPLKNTDLVGIDGSKAEKWPGIATLTMGTAATLFDSKYFDIGASLDFAFPSFQNFVLDAGLQMMICDIVKISSAWELDVRELANGHKNLIPAVAVGCKFIFSSKEGSLLANKGWAQSEISISGAWRQLYKNINAASAGAKINLGLVDTQAPEIMLWGEE